MKVSHPMRRTMPETVLSEVEGRVATLTLNRPDRLNAIVPALIRDLDAALDRAQEDDEVHAIACAARPHLLRRL